MNHKRAIIIVISAFLSACSADSLNETVADSVAQVVNQAETESTGNEQGDNDSVGEALANNENADNDTANEVVDNGTTENTNNTDTPAVFGPPQFIVSECGSVPSAMTVPSTTIDSPAEFFVGEPVDGQLVPGSDSNSSHIWQITLEAGNYHLVVDTFDIPDPMSTVGISVTSLGAATADNEDLLTGIDFSFDLRSFEFLEIRNPQVLTLRVDARFDQIHNYTMGIFANGTAVPSPTFNRCQPVNFLALDTTQSVTLENSTSRDDDIFYRLELTSGEFILNASTSTPEDSLLGYQFDLLTGFGETQDPFVISTDSEFASSLVTSDSFENSFEGTAWLRLRNLFSNDDDDITVEFTFSEL